LLNCICKIVIDTPRKINKKKEKQRKDGTDFCTKEKKIGYTKKKGPIKKVHH
jgi:hypothetical protein